MFQKKHTNKYTKGCNLLALYAITYGRDGSREYTFLQESFLTTEYTYKDILWKSCCRMWNPPPARRLEFMGAIVANVTPSMSMPIVDSLARVFYIVVAKGVGMPGWMVIVTGVAGVYVWVVTWYSTLSISIM